MLRTYHGGVFSDTLPDGRAGGDIELLPSGIKIRCLGGASFLIPYRDCQIEMGGYHGKMIFCRGSDGLLTIFSDEAPFRRGLSIASAGMLDDQLAMGQRQRRANSRRRLLAASAFLITTLLCLVAGYFGVRSAARAAVMALPTSVDVQLGNAAMSSMDLEGTRVADEAIVTAMQTIVDRLTPTVEVQGLEFNVHVVDSPTINAFALPGGNIVIYTGLIRSAETPEQVAAVLAHEMSHATLRHGLQRMSQSLGVWAGVSLLIGDVTGLVGAGASLFQTASLNRYSQVHENEADREGVRMLQAADIDPAALPRFLSMMDHGELPRIFSWISTHPDEASRIAQVEILIANLPAREYRPIHIDWVQVQSRLNDLPDSQP